jgi:hypothetical protein
MHRREVDDGIPQKISTFYNLNFNCGEFNEYPVP